jgi:hypothetical protein
LTPSTVPVIVRIAWITAILIPMLVILGELFSGGDSSQQTPEVASTPPAAPDDGVEAQKEGQKTKSGAPQDDRSELAKEQAPGGSHSSSGVPPLSAAQPGDAGGRPPVVTPEPKPPRAPRPKPPRAPPEVPVSSQPPVSESPSIPVEATDTVGNNNGPVGGP